MTISNIATAEGASGAASPPPSAATSVPDASGAITVTDARGRVIKAKLLKPFDRMRLFKVLGSELSTNGPYFSYAITAASVIDLAGEPISPPTTTLQIEALVTRLDDDGLNAVSLGLSKLMEAQDQNTADVAKNS